MPIFGQYMQLLTLSGIQKQQGNYSILQDISFTQQRFQKLAIAGETGSGKTTLLKIIAGLIQPTAGKVLLEQERVLGPDEKLMPGHPGIGYVSQQFELRNNYRVEEELDYTNQLTDEEAKEIYEVCRISHLLKRRTDQLSGGERQRIVTARTLIASPRLLLLDEPFSNLDGAHKQVMQQMIEDIGNRLNISCILISHDPQDVLSWADEILVLQNGQLVQQASPTVIYRQPVNEYVAALFGPYNIIHYKLAVALGLLTGVVPATKNILVRPEQIILSPDPSPNSLQGTIRTIRFFGSYYEAEVYIDSLQLVARLFHEPIDIPARVYISFTPGIHWYI